VEFAGDTLARYEVEYSARTNELRKVGKPRLFETRLLTIQETRNIREIEEAAIEGELPGASRRGLRCGSHRMMGEEQENATIEGGVGQATVLLPSEIGVKAKAEGGLGGINAKGLKKVGGAYVNDAYGESDTNLTVDVKGGVGEINLKVV